MKRSTTILVALVVVLWGLWFVYSRSEKRALSVSERKEFFEVDTTAVDSIAIKYATWSHLARRDGVWQAVFSDYSHPADDKVIADIFRTTNDMVLENLIATKPEKLRTFEVDSAKGTVMKFFARGKAVSEYVVGKAGADFSHTYIRRLGADSVFMARGDFQRLFRRPPSDWVSKIVFKVDTSELASVRWIDANGETRIEQDADGAWKAWRTGSTVGMPVDSAYLDVRLKRLCPLRADAFAPDPGTGSAMLDSPGLQLIMSTKDGRADTLLFNPVGEKDDRTYAFHPGRPKPLFVFFKGSYDRLIGRYDDLVKSAATP